MDQKYLSELRKTMAFKKEKTGAFWTHAADLIKQLGHEDAFQRETKLL